MKYTILLLNIIFLYTNSYAQNKRDYIWLFGFTDQEPNTPGTQSFVFDFNKKPFKPRKSDIGLGIASNNVSICDKNGNLLFHSNGCAVLNAEHKVMPNGDSINPGYFFDTYWEGDCNNGYPGTQNILILTDPANQNGYYIIHKIILKKKEKPTYYQDILYTYVDMTLDNGKGDVVKKNIVFYDDKKPLGSYLTAIRHANSKDWWILQPLRDTNLYATFLLDQNGLQLIKEQQIGKVFDRNASASGTATFSPDGTKYAYYNESDGLLLFDFDRNSGMLSNYRRVVPFDIMGYGIFCSVEWSPNSRFVYTATSTKLHQIDTWEEDLQDGVRLIDTYDGTRNPFFNGFFLMALAPDCRIYMCSTNGNRTYHVINKPNELGKECDFVQNGIVLPYYEGGSMPNFPRWRVDEEDKCDSTIVSVFGDYVYYRRDLEVYPNPSEGIFNVRIPDGLGKSTLVVTNINGEIIKKWEISGIFKERQIDITGFPIGHYNIDMYPEKNPDRIVYSRQVVKVE